MILIPARTDDQQQEQRNQQWAPQSPWGRCTKGACHFRNGCHVLGTVPAASYGQFLLNLPLIRWRRNHYRPILQVRRLRQKAQKHARLHRPEQPLDHVQPALPSMGTWWLEGRAVFPQANSGMVAAILTAISACLPYLHNFSWPSSSPAYLNLPLPQLVVFWESKREWGTQ